MITLSADVYCDRCKTVIGSGEPADHWRKAVDSAIANAKAKGGIVGLVSTVCRDCSLLEPIKADSRRAQATLNQGLMS